MATEIQQERGVPSSLSFEPSATRQNRDPFPADHSTATVGACRTGRELRSLSRLSPRTHLSSIAFGEGGTTATTDRSASNPRTPFLQIPRPNRRPSCPPLSTITTRHAVAFGEAGNPPPCYSRAGQSAAPTDYTTTPSRLTDCRPTPFVDCVDERLPTTPRH